MTLWNKTRRYTLIHNVLFLLLLLASLRESCAWMSRSFLQTRHRQPLRQLFSSSSESAQQQKDTPRDFTIRACKYEELAAVADIIMDAFYTEKSTWRRLYQLAELNRLQQNFPYTNTDLHQMLVAVVVGDSDERIAGFVDIDARPCQTKIKLPRPYLSDLAVNSEFRRRGIARALVEECERFVQQLLPAPPVRGGELWIRVEETNDAAVAMYTKKLDYEITGSDNQDKDKGTILILHKEFEEKGAAAPFGFEETAADKHLSTSSSALADLSDPSDSEYVI
jgi:ribosomal protein S18 acetylase RimI-like enzyme